MTALAFDPWAARKTRRERGCPGNPPNPANPGQATPSEAGEMPGIAGDRTEPVHLPGGGGPSLNPPDPRSPEPAGLGGLAGLGRGHLPSAENHAANVPALPGVPAVWCEGVARLAAMPAPDTITAARWGVLAVTSARLLRGHGAALHGARWDALDLFGLHPTAPMRYPPGWSLAWLLGDQGEVLDIAPDAVGLRRQPDGARLVLLRRLGPPSAGIVPARAL